MELKMGRSMLTQIHIDGRLCERNAIRSPTRTRRQYARSLDPGLALWGASI